MHIVQIENDFALCKEKFRTLISIPIAAQFLDDNLIAMFSFEQDKNGISISSEKHYLLVPPKELTPEELDKYSKRPFE